MPGQLTATELRAQRYKLHKDNEALLDKVASEKRTAMTAEETAEWEKRDAAMTELETTIKQVEAHETRTAEMAASRGVKAGKGDSDREIEISGDEANDRAERENRAFNSFLKNGREGLTAEEREILTRAQATSNTAGGYTVAPAFYAHLTEALKAYGGMRQVATVISTATGATLPMPTVNSTAILGAILGENVQDSTQDETFGVVNIGAFKYTSKIVQISLELLQDSAFDLNAYIARILGVRIARRQNVDFTTGAGTTLPFGVLTQSSSGTVGATGQTLTVIYDDLVNLQHSVDPAYRENAVWMMADTSLQVVKKIKDSQNRPLFVPGIAFKEPDTILGQKYVINQAVPVMAANAKSILYGDMSTYFIRDVLDMTVVRLVERYADFGQVGFVCFARADGNLLNAGTNPVKYYANSAT